MYLLHMASVLINHINDIKITIHTGLKIHINETNYFILR